MFDDVILNKSRKRESKKVDTHALAKEVESMTSDVLKTFFDLYGKIPRDTERGLSGMCGDWPLEDTVNGSLRRINGNLQALRSYMIQAIDFIEVNENVKKDAKILG